MNLPSRAKTTYSVTMRPSVVSGTFGMVLSGYDGVYAAADVRKGTVAEMHVTN